MIKIDPPIDFTVKINGTNITLTPTSEPNSAYKVRIEKNIMDKYGQNLSKSANFTCYTSKDKPYPSLNGLSEQVILEPSKEHPPRIFFQTTGYKELNIQIFQVDATDIQQYQIYNYVRQNYQDWEYDEKFTLFPGLKNPFDAFKSVHKSTINVKSHNSQQEIEFVLSEYLQHPKEGLGQLVVVIEPSLTSFKAAHGLFSSYNDRNVIMSWIQCNFFFFFFIYFNGFQKAPT